MKRASAFPAFAALFALAAPAGVGASMMVTDLQGRALVGDGKAITMLHAVPSGAELQLSQAASLVLTDLGTGKEYVLQGPGRFTVGAGSVRAGTGEGVVESRQLAMADLPPVKASSRIALAAVRMRSTSLVGCSQALDARALMLEPDMTALSPPVAALRWPEVPGAGSYRVSVLDNASRTLATTTIESTSWEPPSRIVWDEGHTYTWQVQGLRDGVPVGEEAVASFAILPRATARMLRSLKPHDDAPLSRRVLYAAQLQEAGDLRAACQEWRRIQELRPDDAGIRRLAK